MRSTNVFFRAKIPPIWSFKMILLQKFVSQILRKSSKHIMNSVERSDDTNNILPANDHLLIGNFASRFLWFLRLDHLYSPATTNCHTGNCNRTKCNRDRAVGNDARNYPGGNCCWFRTGLHSPSRLEPAFWPRHCLPATHSGSACEYNCDPTWVCSPGDSWWKLGICRGLCHAGERLGQCRLPVYFL